MHAWRVSRPCAKRLRIVSTFRHASETQHRHNPYALTRTARSCQADIASGHPLRFRADAQTHAYPGCPMFSVRVESEHAIPSPFRDTYSLPLSIDLTETEDLSSAIRAMIEDPALEQHFDTHPQAFHLLLQRLEKVLDAAFANGEDDALEDVHAALFALYELHVAPAASERCANQFNPYLIRVRGVIERRWLASEAMRAAPLDADVRTGQDLTDAIRAVSAQHRASHHPLFDFLETEATQEQLAAFFRSDSALNIRFFDLIVLALLGSDPSVRGELSQNFWDEAGKGDAQQSHVTLFRHLLHTTGIPHADDDHASLLAWQGLAGYNLFMMTGLNRSHGLKSLGVMAVTELLDPTQYEKLTRGCRRLGMGHQGELEYYDEHVSIDVVHAEGWLSNVIVPLATKFPSQMNDIYAGAQWRLNTCAAYYDDLHARLLALR